MSRRKSTEEFVEEYYSKYGNVYDLSKFIYINNHTKGIATCKKHGDFQITPKDLLHGVGCKYCGIERKSEKLTKSLEEFKSQYYAKFGNTYDLSKFIYQGDKICGTAVCYKHGEFSITPHSLLNGYGCKECSKEKRLMSKENFIKQYVTKFGNKYDFSKFVYKGNKKECIVICSKHGEFPSTPNRLLSGHGCPFCNESKLEKEISNLLTENNIQFEHNKRYKFLNGLQLDFYIPYYKIAIECQGKQHFEPIELFGGKERLEEQQLKDKQKLELCKINNITLLYYANYKYNFPYNVITKTDELLKHIFKCQS